MQALWEPGTVPSFQVGAALRWSSILYSWSNDRALSTSILYVFNFSNQTEKNLLWYLSIQRTADLVDGCQVNYPQIQTIIWSNTSWETGTSRVCHFKDCILDVGGTYHRHHKGRIRSQLLPRWRQQRHLFWEQLDWARVKQNTVRQILLE